MFKLRALLFFLVSIFSFHYSVSQVRHFENLLEDLDEDFNLEDTAKLIQQLNSLSLSILFDSNDSIRARKIIERNLELSLLTQDTTNYVSTLGNMANVLGNNGWPEKSIRYARKVLSFSIKNDSIEQSHAYAYNHIGIMKARFMDDYDSALYFLNKGEAIGSRTNNQGVVLGAKVWQAYSIVFGRKLDLLDSAIQMARIVRDSEKMNLISRKTASEIIMNAWSLKNNEKEIYSDYYKARNLININNDETFQKAIREADAKYEVTFKDAQLQIKEQEVALNEANLKKQRTLIFSLVLILLFIVIFISYLRKLLFKNRKLAQRNELLVREQNHRVKNNLQMISSLLSLQAGKTQDEVSKAALKQSQGRIQAIALLNRSLYDQEEIGDIDLKVYISELITEVINSITDTEVKYQLDIDDIKLDLEKTTSLGLIINELIVNSVKYVKQSVTEFSLSIKEQSGKFFLEYADNGENFDLLAYQNSKSFGKKLVELQAKQLRGLSKVSDDSQFRFSLNFV